jgi:hypothetical protein
MERKAKLIKTDVNYLLENSEGVVIASTSLNKGGLKLSKQNCDEIFGVVNVEKLADEITKEYATLTPKAFKRGVVLGINKVMELSKDKVFTLEDMKRAFKVGFSNGFASDIISQDKLPTEKENLFNEFIQSIQKPTEIEVKIVMEYVGKCNGNNDNGCFQDSSGHNCGCFNKQPKIDSEGCLILKKI